jgi:hypothetical protein
MMSMDEKALVAAREAYRAAEESPHVVPCPKCEGRGYHHGFGEDGADPDYCSRCGGGGYDLAEGEEHRPLNDAISAYLSAAQPVPGVPTHKHLKSGHLVRVIGNARMQSASWIDEAKPAPVDCREVVIYEHDGNLWARPIEEFNDGRFEILPTPQPVESQREPVAEEIIAPAECGPNCDDPECPYSHKPLTLRTAYDNALYRLRAAESEIEKLRATPPSPAQGTVERAEPVAWLRPKDIARLAEMQGGAIAAQIANLSFVGCTVPVFASPPVDGDALKALEVAASVAQHIVKNGALVGDENARQLQMIAEAALSSHGSRSDDR